MGGEGVLAGGTLASVAVGPIGFDRPEWLVLVPVLGAFVVWMAHRSLSGLGGVTKWTAIGARLLVILLVAGALARPSWRTKAEDVSVIAVVDASRSIPPAQQDEIDRYIADASESGRRPNDRLGTVTVARQGLVQSLPKKMSRRVERQFIGATDGTNLAEGVGLALATAPKDSATRVVLVSDGNETAGSLLRAAEAALAVGVPVDVLLVEYEYTDEVIVDKLVTPATVRLGETINVRVVLNATRPAVGRLLLSEGGELIDLDPGSPELGVPVELEAGPNVFNVPVTPRNARPQAFEAVFEPIASRAGGASTGDSVPENNRARSITFVGAEGSVLIVAETFDEASSLERALNEAEIGTVTIQASQFPVSLPELNAYEAVILANEPAYNFTEAQQEMMRQYVHDTGGGLVMVGGPDAFGAGGWIGSPLADALPIRLDPPQKRQMPRGALVLVMHSIEAPRGVYLAKETCNAAVDNLSRLDLVGIVEYEGFSGVDWVHEIDVVGDRSAVKQSINRLQFGDMPSFDESLNLALAGLIAVPAGQKHVIVISDGDPSLSRSVLRNYRNAGVTISAIGINPHSPRDLASLRLMAERTGGEFYDVGNNPAIDEVVSIFIKEAQTVRRSLIWEGDPFSPAIVNSAAEPMRGIRGVPPIRGYVVAAEREGLSLVTLRGQEEDPVGAIWQYGLGKVVTFTSDATSRWGAGWVGWQGYRQFWEQHVRWAMRPGGSATVRVTTEHRGDETLILIEALDPEGERLNFAQFNARVANPDGSGAPVEIRQAGPGRYIGTIDSAVAGSYVVNLNYRAPVTDLGTGETTVLEGSAQAAVSRPFADEFRSLSSNRALLKQVAELTGGRELSGDPGADDLWMRDGLTMPIATRPIWVALAIAGIGLFLVDVGVRRVRLDPRAMAGAIGRAFGRGKARDTSESVESLRRVRERAQSRMATDGERTDKDASRKFEADPGGAAPTGPIALSGEHEGPAPIVKPRKKPAEDEPEDTLSALRRAKRQARDEMEE